MLSALLLALVSAVALPGPGGVGDRVDRILADWRSSEEIAEDQVEKELLACGAEAVPHLCALLKDAQERLPAGAMVGVLGRLRDPRGIATLEAITGWTDLSVALRAVDSLTAIARKECVPSLLNALDDPRAKVRSRSEEGLRTLHAQDPRLRIVQRLLAWIPLAEHKFEPALLAAELGGDEARPGLLALLAAASDETTMAVLDGLRPLCQPEDGVTLSDLLRRSRSNAVQRKCALLLGHLKYQPVTRYLMDLMAEADGGLAKDAHWALRQVTGLRLKADPDLWEQWWKRGGAERSGPQDG